jgi:hypothetical protein
MEVKDFGPTPFDYISTDLDYKLLKQKRSKPYKTADSP